MHETIVICGHSLTGGGLQRVTGLASLALAELGYEPVLILNKTEPVDFPHAGRLLPRNLELSEVREAFARARLILDYGWNNFTPFEQQAAFHRYLAENHAERLLPTAHNTLTIGQYLDIYRDLRLLHRVPAIICVSQAVRTAAEARYGSLPNARVILNAIAPEYSVHARHPCPHPRPYFLFVGRTTAIDHKGLDNLMKSWSLARLGDTHDLILLGDPPPPPALLEIIAREGISSSVRYQPFTADPSPWMRHAEALVLSSRHEGLGLVLPEALHAGTPCIVTRCGGPQEVIQDGINGLLLDVGDIYGFATAMVRMAREPGLRAHLAACARASAAPFLFSNHVKAWRQLLEKLHMGEETTSVLTTVNKSNAIPPPTITIQLPVYNKVNYLRECLNSIIAQTFTDFEILCVDDGSTDGSWDILQEFAVRDPRFRLFRHEINLGTMAARKRCFLEAHGEYMAFVDADDTVRPEWLCELLEVARRENADFVQCAAEICDHEKILPDTIIEHYRKAFSPKESITLEGEKVFRNLGWRVKTNLWLSLVARSVYRAIYPHIPNEPIPHGNDSILIFMMAYFSKKFVSFPTRLYCYCANSTSANLVIQSPEIVLGHIRSRARIVHIAKEFLMRVAPQRSLESTPFERFTQNCRGYTQILVQRCLEHHPETRGALERAFAESFSPISDAGYIQRSSPISQQTPAPKAAKVSGFAPTPLPSLTFLGRFRARVRRWRWARRIRQAGLFFPEWYLNLYPDVKAAGADPLKHFLTHGAREGRNPNPLFDTAWYLRVNPDVASSGMNPLVHYLLHGWRESRLPSPYFNVVEYLRLRPDVARKAVEPLGHFLVHGSIEGTRFPISKLPAPEAATLRSPGAPIITSSLPMTTCAPAASLSYPSVIEPPSHAPCTAFSGVPTVTSFAPIMKLSTLQELGEWYHQYPDFVALREKMLGRSEINHQHADLKLIQDLAMVDFMTRHLRPGAKVLEIGGGLSRLLVYFKDRFECWLLDKFEGIGNGPTQIPPSIAHKIVPDYIGTFSEDLPSGYFDFVFSISVFEHIKGDVADLNAITDDINRLLKPSGLQAHCMDCRFPPNGSHDLPRQRPLINHVIVQAGFKTQYIYDHYRNSDVFTMSVQAYDRHWKKACNNRSHELDGLPFNIFLAAGHSSRIPAPSVSADTMETTGIPAVNGRRCNICGSNIFKAAWAGRLNNGSPPRCTRCCSCERHRVIRRSFEDMPPTWFEGAELLQFSEDPSVPTERFGKVEISIFQGKNHLDLQAIDRPDASYDWVVCNHVLEHVSDDRKALRELLRIVKPEGSLLFSYPQPISNEKTDDWGWPDANLAYHYRTYGRDAIATRFIYLFNGWHVLSYTTMDPVTETQDMCYFATRDQKKFAELQGRPHWAVIVEDGRPVAGAF